MQVQKQASSFIPLQDGGLYQAVFAGTAPGPTPDSIRLQFEVYLRLEGYATSLMLRTVAPAVLAEGNKLDKILRSLGVSAAPGDTVDIDSLLGTPCVLMLQKHVRDGQERHHVARVLPAEGASDAA